MRTVAIGCDGLGLPADFDAKRIEVLPVRSTGELLDAAYDLLRLEFPPAELDSLDKYVDWIQRTESGSSEFPFVMIVAVCRARTATYVLGALNGNLMPVVAEPFASGGVAPSVFAIGYQLTARLLREAGVRGIGKRLWTSAMSMTRDLAERTGLRMDSSLVESEPGAVSYWDRMGYLVPTGVQYVQPPLHFHPDGSPVYSGVPLQLMIRPETPCDSLSAARMRGMINAVYKYWGLDFWRSRLSAEAYSVAERFVMGTMLEEVCGGLPQVVPLRPPDRRAQR